MSELNLVSLEFEEEHLLPDITASITEILALPVQLGKLKPNLSKFYSFERTQYDAAGILAAFEKNNRRGKTIILTSVDLYIPIFTFVFGLAKLDGNAGIVSTYRLNNALYGLAADKDLLLTRTVKEIAHELGHLINLRHCPNYSCVMASSNTVDDLDVKNKYFCNRCIQFVEI